MTASKPAVVYWNNIPSPYVVGRFNAIADRANLDFSAIFDAEREAFRSWTVDPSTWRFHAEYAGRTPFVVGPTPDMLITLFNTPRFMVGSTAAKLRGSRVAFRVLPTFDSWQPRSRQRELAKHLIFGMADAVKAPGPNGAAVARRYGVPPERVFRVTQSIDVEHYGRALSVPKEDRTARRDLHGLKGTVFLYVGRLWTKKGIDTLLDAYRHVRAEQPDVSLLLIGDGVDESRIREQARTMDDVVFAGFVQPVELPSWYALADVFVFPTLGDPHGLVVEEAMAAGLPVISSASAGDIGSRLPDGEAGFIVPPANARFLADRMLKLTREHDLRSRFARTARELVKSRAHEQYAIDFERFVEATLRLPRRFDVRMPWYGMATPNKGSSDE